MKIEISNKDFKDIVENSYFGDMLADAIVKSKKDTSFNELDRKLIETLEVASKKIVKEAVEKYYLKEGIEGRVKKILNEMTKEDIIKVLSKKI